MQLQQYGYRPSEKSQPAAGIPARVTAVHKEGYEIVCDAGTGFARLKSGSYRAGEQPRPVTGDFVLLDWRGKENSRILKTLPRKTIFTRPNPSPCGKGEQAVAANFDFVFILQSLERGLNPRLIERYLTLAWQSGGIPAILLTKSDAVQDSSDALRAARLLAGAARIFAVSARTGQGLDGLKEYLCPGNTILMVGPSGAGKSTLVNALAGEEVMVVGSVREADSRGRHTTTHRQLLLLGSGAMVIDTPGMRELGMGEAGRGLQQSFGDVEQYLGRCKFSDCRHQSEPGCAVREAVRAGELSPARWESYLRLNGEAEPADKPGRNRKGRNGQADYCHEPCAEHFTCKVCGALVTPDNAGSQHRNHCPRCLSSVHVDNRPGDRASLCKGIMEPIGVWVRKNGEWAIIHRCRSCGTFSSNRIAADDNPTLLMSIAIKPLAVPPFPLWQLGGHDAAEK